MGACPAKNSLIESTCLTSKQDASQPPKHGYKIQSSPHHLCSHHETPEAPRHPDRSVDRICDIAGGCAREEAGEGTASSKGKPGLEHGGTKTGSGSAATSTSSATPRAIVASATAAVSSVVRAAVATSDTAVPSTTTVPPLDI
ncbi:hypothetical protein BS78_01G180200 [Paspalum vaginatum]|nr:hypothetical protein BS78_01G180200 [Paspalum vaginatum]